MDTRQATSQLPRATKPPPASNLPPARNLRQMSHSPTARYFLPTGISSASRSGSTSIDSEAMSLQSNPEGQPNRQPSNAPPHNPAPAKPRDRTPSRAVFSALPNMQGHPSSVNDITLDAAIHEYARTHIHEMFQPLMNRLTRKSAIEPAAITTDMRILVLSKLNGQIMKIVAQEIRVHLNREQIIWFGTPPHNVVIAQQRYRSFFHEAKRNFDPAKSSHREHEEWYVKISKAYMYPAILDYSRSDNIAAAIYAATQLDDNEQQILSEHYLSKVSQKNIGQDAKARAKIATRVEKLMPDLEANFSRLAANTTVAKHKKSAG